MTEEINNESEENTKTQEAKEQNKKDDNVQEKSDEGAIQVDSGKACAVLSYFVIGIIWYFLDEKMKKNEFVKFHVKQAIGLVATNLVLLVALSISMFGLMFTPLINLAALVLAVMGILNAVNGDKQELPVIGSFSNKYLKF